jgi:hypothetical protein
MQQDKHTAYLLKSMCAAANAKARVSI